MILVMNTAAPAPAPVMLLAPPGSRLEELLASYESAKAAAEEAAARFEAVTQGIKAELANAAPGATSIGLAGGPGLPRLRLSWRTPWQFDTKSFKRDYPVLYVKYGSQGGRWELRAEK
jgi:hypothetical protein